MLATHGVFAGNIVKQLDELSEGFLKRIVVTNSIPQERNQQLMPNLDVIDVSGKENVKENLFSWYL